MDPDSGPKNTDIIDLSDDNQDYTYFEASFGQKRFYLANFNDCNYSLVTCKVVFDDNYNLLSCFISIILLDEDYLSISKQDKLLSLNDLFEIASKFNDKERFYLSFDGNDIGAYMIGKDYQVKTSIEWILDYALKEDDFRYMDTNDKMLKYLCCKILSHRYYKGPCPFKAFEKAKKDKVMTLYRQNKSHF